MFPRTVGMTEKDNSPFYLSSFSVGTPFFHAEPSPESLIGLTTGGVQIFRIGPLRYES